MIETNKIHYGDCIKKMQKLDNDSIDLIIADPPYNLNKNFGNSSDNWNDVDGWIKWSKNCFHNAKLFAFYILNLFDISKREDDINNGEYHK